MYDCPKVRSVVLLKAVVLSSIKSGPPCVIYRLLNILMDAYSIYSDV